jgi:hypothetical protein
MSPKFLINSLLTLGTLGLIVTAISIFDRSENHNRLPLILGGVTVGIISFVSAGHLISQNKKKINYLREVFWEIIQSVEGEINNIRFADQVNSYKIIHISGYEAKNFLEAMVKEFDGRRDVTVNGNIYYEFDLQVVPYELPVNSIPINPPIISAFPIRLSTSVNQEPDLALDSDLLRELEGYLSQEEWKKADQETAKVMLKIANQTMALLDKDITIFPCGVVKEIDRLWRTYSNDNFGFLPQLEVFNDCFSDFGSNTTLNSENWQKYGSKLGWYANNQWPNHHQDLTFSSNAPKGHLPFLPIWQGTWWGAFLDGQGERFHLLIKRLRECRLSTNFRFSEDIKNQETNKFN